METNPSNPGPVLTPENTIINPSPPVVSRRRLICRGHWGNVGKRFWCYDVNKVKSAAPNSEFLIAVFAGSVNAKMYKIKKKHQSKLGL